MQNQSISADIFGPHKTRERHEHQKLFSVSLRVLQRVATLGLLGSLAFVGSVIDSRAHAAEEQILDQIHFLIPGGAGGGWDGTARGVGEALSKSGIIRTATYENMSGGGGGKAIGYLIENAESQHGTLMVNSTPIVIRSLTGVFDYNFRDLTLVSSVIGDYAAIVVGKNSSIASMQDLLSTYKANPSGVAVGGGSAPGSLDHLVIAMIMEASGEDPTKVKYVAYDAGGKAMGALLSGEITALSTGFSEAVELARSGDVRIIGVSSDERLSAYPSAPTLKEQGIDTTFVNWRGFFANPKLPEEQLLQYQTALRHMYQTPQWAEVRERNGWVDIHHEGADFLTFLENQERVIKNLMTKLGFL